MPVHAITLTHREGPESPESRAAASVIRGAGLMLDALEVRTCYLIEGDLTKGHIDQACAILADPVLETVSVTQGKIPAGADSGTQVIVRRKDGVMDPAEASVIKALRNAKIDVHAVKRAHVYRTTSRLDKDAIRGLSRALVNDVVEELVAGELAVTTLSIDAPYRFKRIEVPIRNLDEAGLKELNSHHSLSMNMAELKATQAYFKRAGREPTDVELEMIAQTWSEHCKHKTLTGPVHYEEKDAGADSLFELAPAVTPQGGKIKGLLQSTIKRATDELDRPFCWSVFVDNAGVIEFDHEHGVCIKVETHNHPSAIEPYGGSGTGIGGVIRDILGTGLGAKPIMNTDVFCVGPLDMPRENVPKGALHPARTLRGVVAGVRDYGNRMGIPTCNGAVYFDERYTGNPLVYAGCIGLLPRGSVVKEAQPGDQIVVIGGRTGRDGIGGATFSSVELTEESEVVSSGAVQIGNAIQEKSVLDVLLKARDENLYNDLTDCGAGGLSSAVGEMGHRSGAKV
ncbi:MAG: AIR synthase related protein, partial [Planctomycetes bacterium]|nr:AIR synthase related protein [Planctomycetota bacterium]